MAAVISLWVRQAITSDVNTVTSDVNGVKNTFSSWDNCMSKSYCKWPVIIAIIIASVIVLSVVWCLARCLCCGLECCCGIFSCCNACCPSGRGRRPPRAAKYGDPVQYPSSPYQGYQPSPALPPYSSQQPQYAQYDAGRKRGAPTGEDSLPAMPSWDTASSRRIPDPKNEDVELGRLGPNQEHNAPLVANQAPAPTGGFGGEALPYQQYGAYHGGDLGTPYRGVDPPAPVAPGYPQQSYSAYTPSQSTRYEPSEQEMPTAYNARVSPQAQRRPLDNSWRDV